MTDKKLTNTNGAAISGEVILVADLDKATFEDLQAMTAAEAAQFAASAYQKAGYYEGKARDAVNARSTNDEKLTVIRAILQAEMLNGPESLRRARERILQWYKREQIKFDLPEGKTFGISGQGEAEIKAGRAKRITAKTPAETPNLTPEAAAVATSVPNPVERKKDYDEAVKERLDEANARIKELEADKAQLVAQVQSLLAEKNGLAEELLTALAQVDDLKRQLAAARPKRKRA